MNDALLVRELEGRSDVARQPQDRFLAHRAFAGDPGAEAVGAQVHGEVDVLSRLRDGPDADDVGVLELRGGLALVAKAALELRIAGIAGLQNLDRDRRAIRLPADERPGEAPLAKEALQGIGAEATPDEISGGGGGLSKAAEPG